MTSHSLHTKSTRPHPAGSPRHVDLRTQGLVKRVQLDLTRKIRLLDLFNLQEINILPHKTKKSGVFDDANAELLK